MIVNGANLNAIFLNLSKVFNQTLTKLKLNIQLLQWLFQAMVHM